MIWTQAAVNSAIVAVLGVALHLKEKNFQETLAKQDEDLEASLTANAKVNDEKRTAYWKNFEDTIDRQDKDYKHQMAELEKAYNNTFGYTNLGGKKD